MKKCVLLTGGLEVSFSISMANHYATKGAHGWISGELPQNCVTQMCSNTIEIVIRMRLGKRRHVLSRFYHEYTMFWGFRERSG